MKNDVSHENKLLNRFFPNFRKNWMPDPEKPKIQKVFSTIIFRSKGIFPENFTQVGKEMP